MLSTQEKRIINLVLKWRAKLNSKVMGINESGVEEKKKITKIAK